MYIQKIISTVSRKFLLTEYNVKIIDENIRECNFNEANILDEKTVCIAFNGNKNFILAMHAEDLPLKNIAFSFTGDHDMYDHELGMDSLKEFLDIIAGHLLGEMSNLYNLENIGISTPFFFNEDLLGLYKKCHEITFNAECGRLKLYYLS